MGVPGGPAMPRDRRAERLQRLAHVRFAATEPKRRSAIIRFIAVVSGQRSGVHVELEQRGQERRRGIVRHACKLAEPRKVMCEELGKERLRVKRRLVDTQRPQVSKAREVARARSIAVLRLN